MQLDNIDTQFVLPARFDSRDVVSINFRHFVLYLREDIALSLKGDIVEVRFLWTQESIAQNHAKRLNSLPLITLSMLELIEDRIEHLPCHVIIAETSKRGCNVAISTPSPLLVHEMINDMICPNKFTMPVLYNHNCTAHTFIKERLERS